MRLFHAVTVYQLLSCIAFCEKEKTGDDNVLILAWWMEEKIKEPKLLNKYFKKVILYDGIIYNRKHENLVEDIDEFIQNFIEFHGINFDEYEEIVVGGAQYIFGLYLAMHGIKFSVYEESCGIMSHPEKLFSIDYQIDKERTSLADYLNIYSSTNENIVNVYCDLDSQEEDFQMEKAIDFKVVDILSKSSKESVKNVLAIFGVENSIDAKGYDVLLLTQQFSGLKTLTFEQHVLIYKLFVDFYLTNKKILIKSHPDDMVYYETSLKNVGIIRELFPSEFIPFVLKNKPKTIATISSTGIKSIRYSFDDVINLNFAFEKEYYKLIKYYMSLVVAKNVGINNVVLVNSNKEAYEFLVKNSELPFSHISVGEMVEDNNDIKNSLIIIDEYKHEQEPFDIEAALNNGNSVIVLNGNDDYGFYRYEQKQYFDSCLPVVCKKEVFNDDDNFLSLDDEVIYFIPRSNEIMKKAKEIKDERKLENTGVTLSISEMSEEQIEIERLKGILAATEKRLVYYLNKEKEKDAK